MTGPPPPPLMTCEQLAERLGVTVRFVRRLVDEHRVPFMKIGKFVRFDQAQIDRWLSTGDSSGTPARPGFSPYGGQQRADGRNGRLRQR